NQDLSDATLSQQVADIFKSEGLQLLGFRQVPVDTSCLAEHVAQTMPIIQQMFVGNVSANNFDRALYLARKQIEQL
ncbi:hypothetical protein, partial [Staphylococcus aureus]